MLFIKQSRALFAICLLLIGLSLSSAWAISDVEIIKSPNDNREYKGLYLDNGLEVLLISDPDADKAAAALNVKAGSFNEPGDREGLAHFLEHMLFLGTAKYPNPSEYQEYINAHGGFLNASTGDSLTQYQFNILPQYLDGALDRFAQFFISPSFNQELVDRERHAVNSEYQIAVKRDGWRIHTVDKVTANPSHPLVRFDVGDLKTLGDDKKKSPIREALINFYNNYYSADRMVLAVIGPQSISELETIVHKYFSFIPKHQAADNRVNVLPYTGKETAKQISIATLGDYQEIVLNFPIPNQRENFNSKSIDYILYLLNATGQGSLYNILKEKKLINSMNANVSEVSNLQDKLSIVFDLTDAGMKQADQVVQYAFAYINFLQKIGAQKRIFNELKLAGERDFMFGEKQQPLDYVMNLSDAMCDYPLDQVLIANVFNQRNYFNPKLINDLFAYLTIDNLRLFVINKEINGDQKEEKFQVEYRVENFSDIQLRAWNATPRDANFTLPQENNFLPEDFSLRTVTGVNPEVPGEILHKPGLYVWHKQDETFKVPRQNILLLLAFPDADNTPQRDLQLSLIARTINDRLWEMSSQFALAGVTATVDSNPQGLILSISMFSDKEIGVLNAVLKKILLAKIEEGKFVLYKQELKRDLLNFRQNRLSAQVISTLRGIIYQPYWLPDELLSVVDSLTLEAVEKYWQEALRAIQIKGLFTGNLSDRDAISLSGFIADNLQVNTKRRNNIILPKLISIKNKSNFAYTYASKRDDAAIVNYYQAATADIKTVAANALLSNILNTPLFDQLRTKEQLGYIVGLSVIRDKERSGIITFVESSSYDARHLNSRMENFFKQFKTKLQAMPTTELLIYKQAFIEELLSKPNSLSEETARYWAKILDGTYRFNYRKEIAEQVRDLNISDVVGYYDSLLINPSTQRKISVKTKAKGEISGGISITDIQKFKHNSVYE